MGEELFHGPTFAFKDVALQFLGNLFEFFLTRRRARGEDARLSILGATSGDTGSAAISGLRGKRGVDCFMLYPDGRVSAIQEQQMATVPDANIHCIAIAGTFDDAQAIVKKAFVDREFNAEAERTGPGARASATSAPRRSRGARARVRLSLSEPRLPHARAAHPNTRRHSLPLSVRRSSPRPPAAQVKLGRQLHQLGARARAGHVLLQVVL